jgi:thioredoxin-like negative regulator of GroEL
MYEIESFEELDKFIIDNNNNAILLYFGATWCGPCVQLKQKLCEEDTIKEMPLIKVCYIDIDKNEDIAELYKISSLPTQIFVKLCKSKVKKISKLEGYDYTKLVLNYNSYILNFIK